MDISLDLLSQNPLEVENNTLIEGYKFLLSDQPKLREIQPKNNLTAVAGGCVTSLIPLYVDFRNTTGGIDNIGGIAILCGALGYLSVNAYRQIEKQREQQQIRVENILMLKNWKRPIFILPESRFDTTVEARYVAMMEILNDEKCLNELHIALENVGKKFSYSVSMGFRSGTKDFTNIGLPVVSLFPELFLLRGANDEQAWVAFQQQAVRIIEEVDTSFGHFLYTQDPTNYKAIAGGQLMV